MMEFSSLRRSKNGERGENRKKTFSISNISFTSGASQTTVIRKSLNISLPRDLCIEQDQDCRVLKLSKSGSAHLSGVIQVGDLVNVFPSELEMRLELEEKCPLTRCPDEFINVNILYGVLQVESRPLCPLIVEIGNRNNTSLGLALTDSPGEKIRISSIQPGSLAERCGYLKPGDILMALEVGSEKVSCSPYYTSMETAQLIRRVTTSAPSVILTILPYEAEQLQLHQQHRSLFSMLSSAAGATASNNFGSQSTLIPDGGHEEANGVNDESSETSEMAGEEEEATGPHYQLLSFSLWKDRLYEDYGFSLTDAQEESCGEESGNKCEGTPASPSHSSNGLNKQGSGGMSGSQILQIRRGGPAYAAGLVPGDRIIKINDEDVSQLESTMLVPILASLDDSLNLTVIRINNEEPNGSS